MNGFLNMMIGFTVGSAYSIIMDKHNTHSNIEKTFSVLILMWIVFIVVETFF